MFLRVHSNERSGKLNQNIFQGFLCYACEAPQRLTLLQSFVRVSASHRIYNIVSNATN